MEELNYAEILDVNTLQMLQDSFAKYSGLAISVVDSKGELITQPSGCMDLCLKYIKGTEKGFDRCAECDRRGISQALEQKRCVSYTCHAGLTDFVVPFVIENHVIGGILAGQVRSDEISEQKARDNAADLGIDPELYLEELAKTNFMPREQVEKTADFLSDFAKTLSVIAHGNFLKLSEVRNAERAARSQSEFITELTNDLHRNMAGWIDRLDEATKKYMNAPELKQEADELLNNAGWVYSQIGSAVDYIRMTSGNVEYFESVYDVRGLIGKTAESLKNQAGNSDVEITARFDDKLPETLVGNSGRIGQIINKLGRSVMNFTNAGGSVEIYAACERTAYSCDLVVKIIGTGTRMTEKAAAGISAAMNNGGSEVLGRIGTLTSKDADFSLIILLLRQLSGRIEAESLSNGNVIFKMTIPQLDGSKKSA